MERLKMSVLYGADAVYLAGTDFGMRSFAGNFTPEELPKAVQYAHEHGVKAHVTVNTMPRNGEVAQLPAWLELLDDAKVAEQVVRRCVAKGYGPSRARQALYEKQVPKEFWDDALADYPDMTDKVLEFLRSRLGHDYDERDVKRAVDALMRRGHSYGVIRRALNELSMETEEFLED